MSEEPNSITKFFEAETLPTSDLHPINSEQRFRTFHGAVYNLLNALFVSAYALVVPKDNFDIEYYSKKDFFYFSIVGSFKDVSSQSHIIECIENFFKDLYCITNDLNTNNVTAFKNVLKDSTGNDILTYAVTFTDDDELISCLNEFSKPYKISIGHNFTLASHRNYNLDSLPFLFNPLYSFEHVNALYHHAKGWDCPVHGMHLSH